MKKAPLYSRSRQRFSVPAQSTTAAPGQEPVIATSSPTPVPGVPGIDASAPQPAPAAQPRRRGWFARHRIAIVGAVLLLALGGATVQRAMFAQPAVLTQQDIDAAVRRSLDKDPAPSPYTRAYAAVRPAVVRVMGLDEDDTVGEKLKSGDDPRAHTRSTGTGVVIIDNGTILTNLHVVVGAKRIHVTFYDGHESEASLVGVQPENDLAVLRAKSIPDDLVAATMRGTGDLLPGDQVLAVGFPFGIGPSASGGVISGLRRSFRAPEGERLTNLIQFDAAANPGNSGGPLVTMDGSVVGIVTAILNPGDQGTFIGIGFAVPIENAAAAVGMPPF
jgi:S1-C subfamily serine protease